LRPENSSANISPSTTNHVVHTTGHLFGHFIYTVVHKKTGHYNDYITGDNFIKTDVTIFAPLGRKLNFQQNPCNISHLTLTQRCRPCPLLIVIVNRLCRHPAAQMGTAKSDFSQMGRNRSNLIKNAEHFAWIDLDLSDFEKECNHYSFLEQVIS